MTVSTCWLRRWHRVRVGSVDEERLTELLRELSNLLVSCSVSSLISWRECSPSSTFLHREVPASGELALCGAVDYGPYIATLDSSPMVHFGNPRNLMILLISPNH